MAATERDAEERDEDDEERSMESRTDTVTGRMASGFGVPESSR